MASCIDPEMKSPRVQPPASRDPKRIRKPPKKVAAYRFARLSPNRFFQMGGISRTGISLDVRPAIKPPMAIPSTKAKSHDPGPGMAL
jgi:hypothetical protein